MRTWFYRLKNEYKDYDFESVFRRGLTSHELGSLGGGGLNDKVPSGADCLEHYMPSVIIIQLGIVDCVPRLFKKNGIERKIISRLSERIRYFYISFVKKHRKRKTENAFVQKDKFRQKLLLYIKRAKVNRVNKIFFISIPIPDKKYLTNNPNALYAINTYNKIFK